MKKLYIADIRSGHLKGISIGHYIPVAKMYQKIFKNICPIKIAGGPIYSKYFDKSELLLLPHNVCGSNIKDKILIMRNCISLFQKTKNQKIILQSSSVITSFIGILLFYKKKSDLYLIIYTPECINSFIGRILFQLIKKKINGIICPNNEIGERFKLPYCIVPDYIYTGDSFSNNKINYNDKIYDFCIIGRIAPEKGVIECAKKFVNTQYKVLIAGKPQSNSLALELKEICKNAPNIKLHLNYIDNETYSHYLHISKYAILNYSEAYSERSSGVVFDTLFHDVPVIGNKCKTLDFITEKELGYIYKDIYTFNPNIILNEEKYKKYYTNIQKYKQENSKYIKKIIEFINK